MKVLWFSSSPSNASLEFGNTHLGVGWVSALENIIVDAKEHELGICFIYKGTEYKKIIKNGVVYYGIPVIRRNGIQRIIDRQLGRLSDDYESPYYDEVIKDFSPDIIHVFGTENGYGKILINKFEKVVFHLQGLVAPYYEVYFPPKISKWKALFNDSLDRMVRGLTFFHSYNAFHNMSKREMEIIKRWKYFTGRTDFDRNYLKLLNPSATYFHCEELLRPDFFISEWKPPAIIGGKKKIIIGTTINPNIYKGLDLIYGIIPLLEDYDITWNIYGLFENNAFNKVVKKSLNIVQGNESIHFHGPVSASNLAQELKKCHLFVHPSFIDNSPNSVCEAMLLGMPVLSSSVGGVKTLIKNEENGFLFNPQDRYDAAGLIAHLINNYEIAIKAGKKARETALLRHNKDNIISVINNMYNQIKIADN